MYMLLRFLNSSAGLNCIEQLALSPVQGHIEQKAKGELFTYLMSWSEIYQEQQHLSVIHVIHDCAASLRYIGFACLFDLAPVLADIAIALYVFHDIFGPRMTLLFAAVTMLCTWTTSSLNALREFRYHELAVSRDIEAHSFAKTLANWRTVIAFNQEQKEMERSMQGLERTLLARFRHDFAALIGNATASSIFLVGHLAALLMVAYQIGIGRLSIGSFVMILGYWSNLYLPLLSLDDIYNRVTDALQQVDAFFALREEQSQFHNQSPSFELEIPKGEVVFEGVSCYDPSSNQVLLKDVNFGVQPGQTVVIFGKSGADYRAVFDLLLRLYDPANGVIKIDGHDIKEGNTCSLRKHMGSVLWNDALFEDTLLNNIRYGNAKANEQDVYDICRILEFHDHFASLPEGYSTNIGLCGTEISDEDKERVAIARAFLRKPKIVLIKEKSAEWENTVTNADISEGLAKLCVGRTAFVIG